MLDGVLRCMAGFSIFERVYHFVPPRLYRGEFALRPHFENEILQLTELNFLGFCVCPAIVKVRVFLGCLYYSCESGVELSGRGTF